MSSAPTTPKYLNEENLFNSTSALHKLAESPTASATSLSDLNIDIDTNDTIHHTHSKSSLPSAQRRKPRKRKHKKTTSLSLTAAETQQDTNIIIEHIDLQQNHAIDEKMSDKAIATKKSKIKPPKLKTVAFSVDDNDADKVAKLPILRSNSHHIKRKKIRFKKRKSMPHGHEMRKDIHKNLAHVDQYLLPAPKKQQYYKWAVLDPSDLSTKVKNSGTILDLMQSLNTNIVEATANLCLVQTSQLLICLSNVSSSAPIILRRNCTQSNQTIKEYFQIPIPIRSYGSHLDESSLRHLLSSAREQRLLKAHKSRCKPQGITRKMKMNARWELDTTHKDTIKRLKRLHDAKDPIDWAIFDFVAANHKKNAKYLVINDHQYGTGGSEALSKNLAQIDRMRYAVLAIVYGHIVKHRLVLLIIWNPMSHNAMMKNYQSKHNLLGNGLKQTNNHSKKQRHHSHSSTILFWQHKDKIKSFANAKKEMNINLHSKLAESMIISALHRDGLIDDIIIRVINNTHQHREENKDEVLVDTNPVRPTPVPRQWTLKQLKKKLSDDYKMNIDKIRISLIPSNVAKRRKKSISAARARMPSQHETLEGDEKTLDQLGINHGDQIYIDDHDDALFSASKIKDDRERAWGFIINPHKRPSLPYNHRREMSMPVLRFTVKQKLSKHFKRKSTKKKRKNKKKAKKKSVKPEQRYSELTIPRSFSVKSQSISAGCLPKIRESMTACTPPLLFPIENLPFSAATLPLQKSNTSATISDDESAHSLIDALTLQDVKSAPDTPVQSVGDTALATLARSASDTFGTVIKIEGGDSKPTVVLTAPKQSPTNRIDEIKQKLNMDQNAVKSHKKMKKRKRPRKDSKDKKVVAFDIIAKDEENDNSEITEKMQHISPLSPSLSLSTSYDNTSSLTNDDTANRRDVIMPPVEPMAPPVSLKPSMAPIPAPLPPNNHAPHIAAEAPLPNHIVKAPLPALNDAALTAAPLPTMATATATAPLPALSNGSTVTLPPPPPSLTAFAARTPRQIKTHLHEIKAVESDESEEEDENDLKPDDIFTRLEIEKRNRSSSQLTQTDNSEINTENDNTGNENAVNSPVEDLVPLPDTMIDSLVKTDSNIDLNDIFITSHNVGRGKTASVHQALYKNTVFVAVKEFVFQNLSPAILEDFHKEANTLKNLRHANIAMLVGSYLDEVSGELYIVLEWLPGGCLHDLLHQKDAEEKIEINYYDVLLMAIDIARGMKYLHSKNIIHRDLKTHNLLLDEEYRVKVTDFGTAKHLNQIKSKAFTEVGTLGYVAPEVLDPPINGYDGKVDVFSYGVVLWEIYSSQSCGKEDNVLTSVSTLQYAQRLKSGFRPNIPSDCPKEFSDLITGCWEYKPQKRPTFGQIVLYLEKIIKQNHNEFRGNLYNIGAGSDDEDEYEYEVEEDPEYSYEEEEEDDEYDYEEDEYEDDANVAIVIDSEKNDPQT